MDSKKSFGKKLEHFIEGRGFYIVLVLCAAIIGVSAWSLLSGAETMDPDAGQNSTAVLSAVTPQPTLPEVTPVAPTQVPAATPEAVPEDETATPTAAETAFVWPVEGDVVCPYSMTALLYDKTMSDWRTHDGVDIAAEFGTPVSAMTAGTVTKVYYDDLYGTTVIIENGSGLQCVYSNLEEIPTVYVGDAVAAGDTIGSVGASAGCESAQESHLHLSTSLNGESVSPMEYLPQKN